MSQAFEFEVPATCAHLGPGFGVLGAAIDVTMTVKIEERRSGGFEVERHGAMSHAPDDPRHDPILRGLRAAQERFSIKLPGGLVIAVQNAIPAFSGLGTTSAAFSAGFGIAARYAKTTPPADELLDILVGLGGTAAHGGAALYGGLVASCPVQTAKETVSHRVLRYTLASEWQLVVASPGYHIGTADVVRVLPATLPHGVTKRTSGRLLGLLHALAVGDEALLRHCLVDEVHVPFRRRLVPGVDRALRALEEAQIGGVTISGAGPALVLLTTQPMVVEQATAVLRDAFTAESIPVEVFTTTPRNQGALPDGDT